MAEDQETWAEFLDLVAFQAGLRKLAVEKFKKCDPSVACRIRSNPEDKSRDQKRTALLYNFLEDNKWIEFINSSDKFNETLIWLLEEYKKPRYIKRFPRSESTAQQLDRLLRDLNYLEQRQTIKTEISGSEIAKVALIQANGEFMQKWLVKRLSLEIANHTLSQGFSIEANKKWNKNLGGFWTKLAQQTKTAAEPSEIIQVLCNRCQYQPLIMAIHGIQDIDSACLQQIITVFWEELVRNFSVQPWNNGHSDCILFLTTDLGGHQSVKSLTSYGVDLPPWEFVTITHMKDWLKPREVRELIEKCDGKVLELLPSETYPPNHSLGTLEKTLQNICKTVDLNIYTDLAPYWKIAL
jgi:hypothetical protein